MEFRPVPWARRASTAFVVMGALLVVAVVVLLALSGRWELSPMLLLGAGYLARGLLLRRARVVVTAQGLLVNTGGFRDQLTAWSDVAVLTVDPPGGPRLIRLRRHDGREVQLPELSDADREQVLAARPWTSL